jgi:hypothetical protein
MAAINPCGWLQNAGATHTAEQMRNFVYASEGVLNATSLVPKSGISQGKGNQLQVTQTGSPSMAVIVKSGTAEVAGTESSKQGAYGVMNDADFTISITAAHATLARIDIIVFKVEDSQYSGANNTSSLVVVDGTPAGSPAPPSAPANSITLAQIAVAAAASSIVNANITDTRRYLGKGIFPVDAGGDLPTFGIEGRYRDRQDLNVLERDSGSAWERIAAPSVFTLWTSSFVPVWSSSGTAPAVGDGAIICHYKHVGFTAYIFIRLTWGSTTTGGTGSWNFTMPLVPNFDNFYLGVMMNDNSAAIVYPGSARLLVSPPGVNRVGTYSATGVSGNASATQPFTWAVNDVLTIAGTFLTSTSS